ncbi:hypothetical protein BDN71DRAFT_1435638 [Pleurotus eryngii]|uniref:Uncharacterized protein n=1 Tax=Pleurotus eryngii TaxID=5323 RepID=A0A9P6DAW9_PLEER|nr:hypothetical protein BDN71DRAFT_1435638 [Pleurotus eryngii]
MSQPTENMQMSATAITDSSMDGPIISPSITHSETTAPPDPMSAQQTPETTTMTPTASLPILSQQPPRSRWQKLLATIHTSAVNIGVLSPILFCAGVALYCAYLRHFVIPVLGYQDPMSLSASFLFVFNILYGLYGLRNCHQATAADELSHIGKMAAAFYGIFIGLVWLMSIFGLLEKDSTKLTLQGTFPPIYFAFVVSSWAFCFVIAALDRGQYEPFWNVLSPYTVI